MLFRNIIPIPCRNLNDNFAWLRDHCLTSETRIELQVGGHVQTVGLIVIHFREIVRALFHPYVTRRAGAVAATSVIKTHAVVQRDIQNGLFFAMVLVGQLAVLELHRLASWHEHDFHRVLARCFDGRRRAGLCLLFSHSCSYSNSAFATGCGASGPSPISVPSIVLPFKTVDTAVSIISSARCVVPSLSASMAFRIA